ncbi:MAG: glycoside hydrolase family 2 TIM barrel-domain containing protein, partial [Anaerolineales bacterium]
WSGKAVLLQFGGASYRTEAWVNGRFAGSHEGAYTPFYFDVTDLVRHGADNELIVRVAGLMRTRAVDGQVLVQAPASKQSWYYEYTGLWGEVSLEARPRVSIESIHVEPDLRGEKAMVEVAVANRSEAAQGANLGLNLYGPSGELLPGAEAVVALPPGMARLSFCLEISHPWPWHPDTPWLYRIKAELTAGSDTGVFADRLEARFGMRDFTVHNGQFILNGRPIYLRGVLLQPNYPIGLVTPPNREMMVKEVTLVKEAGFNLIRGHLRPTPPGYLDLTDELGLLVYAESSLAWIRDSPRMLDHGRREMQALVEQGFNHPSVVFWGILNENRQATAQIAEPLMRFTRALDPTRVIVDNSGGSMAIDQDFGWIDRASVIPNRETARQRVIDIHLYLGATVSAPIYDWLRGLGSAGPSSVVAEADFGSVPLFNEFDRELRSCSGQIFVSELGAGGMSDLDETLAQFGEHSQLRDAQELTAFRDSLQAGFVARRLDRVFGDFSKIFVAAQQQQAAGNTMQIEALLSNPRVSGYIICQLNDVAYEFHAGLLDLWRNPKLAYYASQRLNQPHVLTVRPGSPITAYGNPFYLTLTQINRAPLPSGARVELVSIDAGGAETVRDSRPASLTEGIRDLGSFSAGTADVPGRYRLKAKLTLDGKTIAEAEHVVLALERVKGSGSPARVRWLGERLGLEGHFGPANESGPPSLVAAHPASLSEADWTTLLDTVAAGGTAIIGPLYNRDSVAKTRLTAAGLPIELNMAIGSWMGCYHWVPVSDLFAGLPAGGLAGHDYADVLPRWALGEMGGEVLAGSFQNSQTRREAPRALWYSDIEAVAHGAGEIIFCQYRVFDNSAGGSPLAQRLALNLLELAAKRGQTRNG